jgi:hypothetical protein
MIVATSALASPKVRIGHIGGNFVLPRTIPLMSLIAGGGGAVVGVVVALIIAPSSTSMIYGIVIGLLAGVGLVNYSPLKGESFAKYLGLRMRTRRQRIHVAGDVIQVAVGIAVLKSAVLGPVHIFPGAVNVPLGQYDERGTPLHPDEILTSILELSGTSAIAATPLPGAVYLEDVESTPRYLPPRRPLPRPSRVPEPLRAPSAAETPHLEYAQVPVTAPDYLDPIGLDEWLFSEAPTTNHSPDSAPAPRDTTPTTVATPQEPERVSGVVTPETAAPASPPPTPPRTSATWMPVTRPTIKKAPLPESVPDGWQLPPQ